MHARTRRFDLRAERLERSARLREHYADELGAAACLLRRQGALTSVDILLRASRHQRVTAMKLRAFAALVRVSGHVVLPDPGRART